MAIKSKYEGIIDLLSYLVKERVYGPVDRMARATDPDMVRLSLYEAIRYASTELRRGASVSIPSEDEVREFLDVVERRVGTAREVAIKALTRGLKMELSQLKSEQTKAPEAGAQAK
jgi:CRISPR type I-A-associated protein Csa5